MQRLHWMTAEQQRHLENGFDLLCVTVKTVAPPLICTRRHGTHCAWYVRQNWAQAYPFAAKLTSGWAYSTELYSKIQFPECPHGAQTRPFLVPKAHRYRMQEHCRVVDHSSATAHGNLRGVVVCAGLHCSMTKGPWAGAYSVVSAGQWTVALQGCGTVKSGCASLRSALNELSKSRDAGHPGNLDGTGATR